MEYNKKLYDALERVYKNSLTISEKLETIGNNIEEMKSLNRQLKHASKVVEKYKIYKQYIDAGIDAEDIIKNENDKELIGLAQTELDESKHNIPTLEDELKILLLPVDPNDNKNVIIEMRPAAGGDESSIFVGNLFDSYKQYAENQNWKISILEVRSQAHGYDFISFSISGDEVYSKMKFESGVHRVQRVPLTESKGRVHTSTITVAVLPEQDEIDVKINPSDLRIDTYRASGAGGQHVNRTESAVRLTHLPTGVVAACQDGKSQIQNRETAMRMLRAKLWEKASAEQHDELSSLRKGQVGRGDRSEKIRTYNYPQNRVTDHRIGLSVNKLDQVMLGKLDEIIDSLIADEQTSLMSGLVL